MSRKKRVVSKEPTLSISLDGEVQEQTGQETEASIRHQESPLAEVPERDSDQTIPGPLDDHEEKGMEPTILRFWQPTEHRSR